MHPDDDDPWAGDCGLLRRWLINRVLDLLVWLMPENDKTYKLELGPTEGVITMLLAEQEKRKQRVE